MIRRHGVRIALIISVLLLSGALIYLLQLPLPNVFAVGLVGALLGMTVALLFHFIWK